MRVDGRTPDQLRPVLLTPDFITYPEGSVLIELGNTRVLCNVSITDGVPAWLEKREPQQGWITAEYALLPRSTTTRTPRETKGLGGRTQEIKRLIGRSLRPAVDLAKLGPRTCIIDCDVLQADGGTRTAAITGGYLALALAIGKLTSTGKLPEGVLQNQIAAVSAGIVAGEPLLDLCYAEDSTADSDMNVVMTALGQYIEIQSSAEAAPFSLQEFNKLLDLASQGISSMFNFQDEVIQKYI
jgi:ribonuclease PH